MYVPNNAELKKEILDEAHCSTYAMHLEAFQEALGSRLLYSTTYHPQTNGQSDRTIQTLDEMLRSSVLQFGDAWHHRLDLMEFAYNNSYHSSIGMSPFKALYGKSCRTLLCWSEIGKRVLVGPEIIIKSNLKVAQDPQKSLADKHAADRVYKVGDWVFLKLSPWRGVVRFGKKDPSHVIPHQPWEINPDLSYDEEPVTILDWKDKVMRNKTVRLVKFPMTRTKTESGDSLEKKANIPLTLMEYSNGVRFYGEGLELLINEMNERVRFDR
ncbi:unnamed protein product [Malus baccata var. baccata]